ncbi:hypothetical protein L596_030366 [Steinernema carpocapsae]|uniref:Protein kinase domain-containing protein n=1 Tax=Steinernema carpocapsae TaxID=34508 RepID=A0A4U5LP78_STECR|nr:hypothetical protein L596_030366 [Steinernema carpocapsae]
MCLQDADMSGHPSSSDSSRGRSSFEASYDSSFGRKNREETASASIFRSSALNIAMSSEDGQASKLPTPGENIQSKRHSYEIIKMLGKGGFGAVYQVKRGKDEEMFAMKCETNDVKKAVLTMDCKVLRGANIIQSPHFCTVQDRGKISDRFRFLIMKLVGRNLWDLRMERDSQSFTLSTSLKCAEQSLMSIEDLHRIGFLHRDIKPGNFAIGCQNSKEYHTIFMLDFGLCRKFIGDNLNKDLRMPRTTAPFRGTTRYAAIAALRQMEQSRKDDIEAWLYMVVEWTSAALPWRKLKGADKEEVLRWKEDVRSGDALEDFLTDCPKREFQTIMTYLDTLAYQSIPDYNYLYYCLHHAMKANSIDPHEPLDWDPEHKYHGPTKLDRDKRMDPKMDAKLKDEANAGEVGHGK